MIAAAWIMAATYKRDASPISRGEIFFWVILAFVLRFADVPLYIGILPLAIRWFLWPTIRAARESEKVRPSDDEELAKAGKKLPY